MSRGEVPAPAAQNDFDQISRSPCVDHANSSQVNASEAISVFDLGKVVECIMQDIIDRLVECKEKTQKLLVRL
jgi:hypothetical protein